MKLTHALYVLTLILCSPQLIMAGDLANIARTIAEKSQKAVVTAKVVVKMRIGQQEQEKKVETIGTIIDSSGLTVVSASSLDPVPGLAALLKANYKQDIQIESDVTSTALILNDGTELEADVVMKDANLDFAFIRPRDSSRTFDAITLKPRPTTPKVFEEIFVLSRLGGSENRALALAEGKIRSVVKGPRQYFLCDNNFSKDMTGCVAFGADGFPVGIIVTKAAQGSGQLEGIIGGKEQNTQVQIPILRPVEDVIESASQAKQVKSLEKK